MVKSSHANLLIKINMTTFLFIFYNGFYNCFYNGEISNFISKSLKLSNSLFSKQVK